MFKIPSRDNLRKLSETIQAVTPAPAFGFSRQLDGGRVSVFYSYPHGLGEFVLGDSDVPTALLPAGNDVQENDAAALGTHPTRAIEAFLRDNAAQRVLSIGLPGVEPSTRLWIGSSDREPLNPEQRVRLEAIVPDAAALLQPYVTPDETFERLRRLEAAAGLLPALLHVLDIREVIDRLSKTAKRALPHDLLLLFLFADDVSKVTIYARSDLGSNVSGVLPNPYPPAAVHAWEFNIIDDHTRHPLEQHTPATKAGGRSSLRFPIRFDGQIIGGIGFISFSTATYSEADVPVGRRLSDHVASAISHFKLAQRFAEQARHTEELRARTTNLELLDELLSALTDARGVGDAFERISEIARKVLAHDALALPVFLPDGHRARRYATSGLASALPEVIEVPSHFLSADWEYDLFDDVTSRPEVHNQRVAEMGFASALRVPIRIEGRSSAALIFLSRSPAAFKHGDILVARRIADRLAVTLARDRELEADRRADEATERAGRLEARVRALTDELDARTGFRRIVGESTRWRQVLTQATQVAATETTALLLGESGTGKEVIARFLHRASQRSQGPFIALNCAALPEQLLEAELFGYERGAYTGATQSKPGQLEQAAGGTLFLDEVAEMSPSAQAKFLRVLQEREFQRLGGTRILRTDARIVAATNRDLQRAIAQGQFREDLYYRLNVFPIRLPPLRERRDDILPLSEAFLHELGKGLGRPPGGVSRDARRRLLEYHWPGNVRELRNILERAAILCDGGLITEDHLALTIAPPSAASVARDVAAAAPVAMAAASMPAASQPVSGDLHAMERAMIEQALQSARFNKSKAAKALGLTRHQLYIRMRKHGFE